MWALWDLGVKERDPAIPGRWGVFPKLFSHPRILCLHFGISQLQLGCAAGMATGRDKDGTAGKSSTVGVFTPKSWVPLKQSPTAFPGMEKRDDGVENLAQWGELSLGGSMGEDLSI